MTTDYQSKYLASLLDLQGASDSVESLSRSGVRSDIRPLASTVLPKGDYGDGQQKGGEKIAAYCFDNKRKTGAADRN